MTQKQEPDKDEQRKAIDRRIRDLAPAAIDTLTDLVAEGYGPAMDEVKKRGLEAEVQQWLRDRGKPWPPRRAGT